MAKIITLRCPIREFTVAVGLIQGGGGLLTICSSREGAYSRGKGLFEGMGLYVRIKARFNVLKNEHILLPYQIT